MEYSWKNKCSMEEATDRQLQFVSNKWLSHFKHCKSTTVCLFTSKQEFADTLLLLCLAQLSESLSLACNNKIISYFAHNILVLSDILK